MKSIPLTQGKVALVDDEDFDRLSAYNWQAKQRLLKDGEEVWYAKRRKFLSEDVNKPTVYMHREIMSVTDPGIDVDHMDGNGLNNCKSNLRVCVRSDNNKNQEPRGIAQYKGVYRNGKGWSAKIKIGDRQVYLGQFETTIQAAIAFDNAARATGNPFYRLNFPDHLSTPIAMSTALKLYEKVHELTGETVSKYKYLSGHPRQYRFDAKEGVFNINGTEKLGRSLTFQPIAWRIFTDNILNMGTKNWIELFFIDDKNCVSAILFHGYSVDNIYRLIEPLYYDDLTLADVKITAVAERKENNNIQPKGIYYIATFSYQLADRELTAEYKAYARDNKLYRQETLTDIANIKSSYNFYDPFRHGSATEVGMLPPDGVDPDSGEVIDN